MDRNENLAARPPIVVVLGHVDHGKTTLLDKIRNTHIQDKEAGGITQKIGASQITTKDSKKITFIDTPGHAAFSNMRSRGAEVADIAILVVAADDGGKPQTAEALDYIKKAKIPFIVAFTKTDMPSASPEKATSQLEKLGVVFEGKGGDIPHVKVSGKTGEGIKDLLETITLVAEVNGIKGDVNAPLEAVVIETSTGKGGPLASIVARNGNLKVGDNLFNNGLVGEGKGLIGFEGKSVRNVGPGDAAQILGFSVLQIVVTKIEIKESPDVGRSQKVNKKEIRESFEGEIRILLKADTAGSLEAITASLPSKVVVIDSGVGEIGESDVLMAKSSKAEILAFNIKTRSSVMKLADTEDVKIETFDIIYKLLERLDEIIKGQDEDVSGKAQIIAIFPYNKKKVAGCKILEGVINKTDKLILKSENKNVGQVKIVSMKKQKLEISSATSQEEFGAIIEPQLDFKVGDMLLSLRK